MKDFLKYINAQDARQLKQELTELYTSFEEVISLMKASSIDKEDALFLFGSLLGKKTHYFVTNYLLTHYPTHNLKYPIPSSQIDVVKEAHFLNRFLNPNDFGIPIPNIRNIDLGA